MTPENRIQRLKEMCQELREMFPDAPTVYLFATDYGADAVNLHRINSYDAGVNALRSVGASKREKTVWDDCPAGRCSLSAEVGGFNFTAFVNDLPPTCRVETVVEKVPKTQTVDTGEFVEISRTKIVCQ